MCTVIMYMERQGWKQTFTNVRNKAFIAKFFTHLLIEVNMCRLPPMVYRKYPHHGHDPSEHQNVDSVCKGEMRHRYWVRSLFFSIQAIPPDL